MPGHGTGPTKNELTMYEYFNETHVVYQVLGRVYSILTNGNILPGKDDRGVAGYSVDIYMDIPSVVYLRYVRIPRMAMEVKATGQAKLLNRKLRSMIDNHDRIRSIIRNP